MAEETGPRDAYPLSPIQQGMLFHWLVDRHSGTDVEQIVGELHEPIDPARLERAWQHAVDSFGVLRTSFAWEGLKEPLQRIEPRARAPFEFEDLRALDAEGRAARLEEFLRADRREGFDLACAPASRVRLFQLGERDFRMIWTFHHILIDGRSFELILNRVFDGYGGRPPAESPDPPYREYIDWVSRQDPAAAREYWRARLEGFTAPTALPTDDSVEAAEDPYRELVGRLSTPVSIALRELAARAEVTVNTLLTAAWALLLSCYGGEDDVLFGVTRTTRRGTIPHADSRAGLFLATVPMRVRVVPDLPVRDWLKQVREAWVSMRGSEHLPLVEIRALSAVPASEPLFQSLVVFENYQFGTRLGAQGGEWSGRRFSIREQTGFPLTLLGYGDDELVLKLEYDTDRFSRAAAGRILGHLTTVLESWAHDASRPVWATPLLTAGEREVLLGEWQRTDREYPADVPLAALVEGQVRRTPSAPAVTFGDTTVSYEQLNRSANRLARELRRLGAGPDVLVGLSVERSIDMMVALLAIVKSGAAYVPLDPTFPRDRIAFMIEDSGLSILVTQSSVRPYLPDFAGAVVDLDRATWAEHEASDLDVPVDPDKLAVVIYTSGSTGRPKGVEISRRSLINLLWSMREWLALGPSDRLLAITTISFDIAGADVWLPWLVGAHTILASREAAADGVALRTLIDRHDVSFLQATPISWRQLMAVDWPGKADLQTVCTGEAMPPEVARFLVPRVRRLWNLYGPTETTIWSTGLVVDDPEAKVMIGRPVANTRCYILDDHLQPVPAGVTGELWIGGHGLARGYLKRPDLTEEKFRPDPFAPEAGARMYRTGDLARFLADGTLECLGRIDHQVKIRGFRIELGEIESVLQDHPAVKQAVVMAREDTPGDKRLVAYFTSEGPAAEGTELRAHLKAALPEYMVPAAFVHVERIPISANGKVDRRSLPAPAESGAAPARTVIRPRTHVERQITDMWEEAFGAKGLSVTDDFFDLGGHSILAVRIMSGVSRVFGVKLPLNVLFEAPTIEQLAAQIENPDRTYGEHTVVSIQAAGTRPPIFWVPGGAALGFFRFQHIVSGLGPDQPVYGLGSRVPKNLEQVPTVEERARSYIELVRRVRPEGPYVLVGFCAGGLVALEMAHRLREAGDQVVLLGLINCHYPGYADARLRRIGIRAQRLRQQIREARANGEGLVDFARGKFTDRRSARREKRRLEEAEREVASAGFTEHADTHNEVLLQATVRVFSRYQPRDYHGRVTLFISDEDDFRGVSQDLDPRLAWREHATEWELMSFPGEHQEATRDDAPGAEDFAAVLKQAIDAASHDPSGT